MAKLQPVESEPSILDSELIMLDSIYPSEYEFKKFPSHPATEPVQSLFCGKFSMTVAPATAGDPSQQNITLVLELFLPHDYPHTPPVIRFQKPRGLSDIQLVGLKTELEAEAEKRRGEAMIYDLVDLLRDFLTRTNFPSVQCPFCLCDIEEGDEFFKSECYHYCHMFCLRRYVEFLSTGVGDNGENLVTTCIVCRTKFEHPVNLDHSVGLLEPHSVAVIPDKLSETRDLSEDAKWRHAMFQRQKIKHGLIEPEPDDKFVITLNHIPEIDRLLQVDQRF